MHKFALALLVSAALAAPTLAQPKEEPKKGAAKVAIPTNTFFKGQTASQYLAGEQLIGVKVLSKDGQTIGTISDLIVGSGDKIEGVILGVGGFLGVGEKKTAPWVVTVNVPRSVVVLPGVVTVRVVESGSVSLFSRLPSKPLSSLMVMVSSPAVGASLTGVTVIDTTAVLLRVPSVAV